MTGQIFFLCLAVISIGIATSPAGADDSFYNDYDVKNTFSTSYDYADNLLSGLEWGLKLGTSDLTKDLIKNVVYSDDETSGTNEDEDDFLPTVQPKRTKSTERRQLLPTRSVKACFTTFSPNQRSVI